MVFLSLEVQLGTNLVLGSITLAARHGNLQELVCGPSPAAPQHTRH